VEVKAGRGDRDGKSHDRSDGEDDETGSYAHGVMPFL
jgi:hypothetical protein